MLNEEQVSKLRMTLNTGGWRDVMRVVIAERGNVALKALVSSPGDRKGEYEKMSDDAIRVRIQEIEWMLAVWDNEVKIHDHNRALEELERQGSSNGSEANLPAPT